MDRSVTTQCSTKPRLSRTAPRCTVEVPIGRTTPRIIPGWSPGARWLAVAAAALMMVIGGFSAMSSSAATTVQTLWSSQVVPRGAADPEVAKVELGTRFKASVAGTVRALRVYRFSSSIGPRAGSLWDSSGRKLASVTFPSVTTQGWQRAALTTPVALKAGATYVVSYSSGGHYAGDNYYFTSGSPYKSGSLTATTGVYRYGSGYPTSTYRGSNYYADVEFVAGTTVSSTPTPTPTVPTPTPTVTPTVPTPTPSVTPTVPIPTPTPSVTPTAPIPTPTPSVTPTVPPTGTGCAARPSNCGYPDATTTGVPTGTVLKRVPQDVSSGPGWHYDTRGFIQIDGIGATFSGFSVQDSIEVLADNVSISNVSSLLGGETWAVGLRHADGVSISNVKIAAPNLSSNRLMVGIKDIYGDVTTLTIRRCDISGTATGIQLEAGVVEDNYIHDLGFKDVDHVNGFTSNAGSTQLTIRHNTVYNQLSQTDAISLFQDFGAQRNRLITNNLLGGGGYALYAGANVGKEATATNIVVTNNRFTRNLFPKGGYWGPYTAYTPTGGNVMTGNVWDDTGAPL